MERILGVYLSGWFIPEPWVTPSLYAATGASNAAELQEAMGTAAYNERMRRHYETFVSEDDFRRMAQIGLNAVRLPVPWYAFGSQVIVTGSPACFVDGRQAAFIGSQTSHGGVIVEGSPVANV